MGAKENEVRESLNQSAEAEADDSPAAETPAAEAPAEASESAEVAESAEAAASASATGNPTEEAANESAAGDPPADDPPAEEAVDEIASLQAQIDQLTQERSALYDQLLRRQAEFENYRKRIERERGEMHQRARAEVILELLPVLDNFERAMESAMQSPSGDALRQGIDLIHRQFSDTLARLGLEPVEAVGRTFDPHLHEAVTAEASDEHEENTVIAELQRGYRLGDRLLRPAKVKVASGSAK